MTISQLIEFLQEIERRAGDVEVKAEWETIHTDINGVRLHRDSAGAIVIINVDEQGEPR